MNVILTMKIKNGGSTVQMNSAEIYTKDAKVVVLCGSTYSRYESFKSELYFIPKKKQKTKKMDCWEVKVLRRHVFFS